VKHKARSGRCVCVSHSKPSRTARFQSDAGSVGGSRIDEVLAEAVVLVGHSMH